MAVYCDVCGDHIVSAKDNYGSFDVDGSFCSKVPYSQGKHYISTTCTTCGEAIELEIATAKAYVLHVTMRAIHKIRNKTSGVDMDIKTTYGETFNHNDSADMAYMIYRRFGRNIEAAHSAWRRLLQNNCELSQFEKLVTLGQCRSIENPYARSE